MQDVHAISVPRIWLDLTASREDASPDFFWHKTRIRCHVLEGSEPLGFFRSMPRTSEHAPLVVIQLASSEVTRGCTR